MKFLKISLLLPLLLLFTLSKSQESKNKWDSIPINHQDGFNIDHVVSTRWLKPVIGPMYEVEVFDDKGNFSLQTRFGFYFILDDAIKEQNIFIVQSAIIFKLSEKISAGTYWFNLQKDYPIKKLKPNEPIPLKYKNYEGYSAPLSLFAKIDVNSIVKTGFFSKADLYFEVNYYSYYNRGASFKIIYTQQLFTTHERF